MNESSTRTRRPNSSNCRTSTDPKYPAPPNTRTRRFASPPTTILALIRQPPWPIWPNWHCPGPPPAESFHKLCQRFHHSAKNKSADSPPHPKLNPSLAKPVRPTSRCKVSAGALAVRNISALQYFHDAIVLPANRANARILFRPQSLRNL